MWFVLNKINSTRKRLGLMSKRSTLYNLSRLFDKVLSFYGTVNCKNHHHITGLHDYGKGITPSVASSIANLRPPRPPSMLWVDVLRFA